MVLVDRILAATDIQDELGFQAKETDELKLKRARMLIEASRLTARQISQGLASEINSDSPSLPVIFQRSLALVENLLVVSERQLGLAELSDLAENRIEPLRLRRQVLTEQSTSLQTQLEQMIRDEQLQNLPDLVRQASDLRARVEQLVREIDALNGIPAGDRQPEEIQQQTVQLIRDLLQEAREISNSLGGGLEPVDIDVDEAMLTALVLRFQLMNQRGQLADVWRDIKLRGDALRDS